MVDKTENEQTPLSDVKFDAEGVAALLALLSNMANQGTGGSTAGTLGNTNQLGAGANASEVSMQSMADVNVPESISTYVGLAASDAQGGLNRVRNISEQILQNAVSEAAQLRQQAITHANRIHTDSIDYSNKLKVDAAVVTDFLHFQGIRGEAVAQDRLWNLDEQVAAAEALYSALGRFISSTKVEEPK